MGREKDEGTQRETLTYKQLSDSLIGLGLLTRAGKITPGMTWKKFRDTPLPVFNHKTLKDVLPAPEVYPESELEVVNLAFAASASTNVDIVSEILNAVAQKKGEGPDWQFKPEILGSMYPDAVERTAEAEAPARASSTESAVTDVSVDRGLASSPTPPVVKSSRLRRAADAIKNFMKGVFKRGSRHSRDASVDGGKLAPSPTPQVVKGPGKRVSKPSL